MLEAGKAVVFTRRGHDWTVKYWPIPKASEALGCRAAVTDGEMVVRDEQHRSSFDLLQAAIGRQPSRLVFGAFDLLHLDGTDLANCHSWCAGSVWLA